MVVSQGRLDDRGGARVVREVRVGGVDQGGPVHENLDCRRSFNRGYCVSETLPNVQNVWARVNLLRKFVRAQVIYDRPLQRRGNSTTIATKAVKVNSLQ